MMQNVAHRVPMPNEKELATLPEVARNLLFSLEDQLPISDYKSLAREFVDRADGSPYNTGSASVKYKNPNTLNQAQNAAGVGEYNPDRIPVATYEKMRMDPQISLATALIELPILAQNFRIDCIDETQAAVVDYAIRPIYRQLIKDMLRAIQFGFATGEKVWEQIKLKIIREDEEGGRSVIFNRYAVVPKKIKFIHPKSARIIRDEKTEDVAYVTQTQDYYGGDGKRTPKVKIQDMIWFALDAEYGNFFGSSRYKNVYQAWYWYQIVMQFMLRYLERRGAPAAVGKAPLGSTTKADGTKVSNIDVILNAANALISNSAVAIPSKHDKHGNPEWDISLLEDQQRGELFLDTLKTLNVLKLRGLFVPDKVATSDGSSTNATTEGHTDVHLLNEEALIQMIQDCLNRQLIPDIIEANFPPSKRLPCTIKIERLNYSKRTLLKEVMLRMIMMYSGSIKDGNWPTWLPSLKEMANFLEVPGTESSRQFLPGTMTNDNNDDDDDASSDDDDDDASSDTPDDKEDKIKENNKKAPVRKERTRRDRRSKERS